MIEVEGIVKLFSDGRKVVRAVDGVSFEVLPGSFYTLLGPSGCGKTTTLRSIAGLERPDQGDIRISREAVFSTRRRINLPPDKRSIGMVFQSYAIWPHMTVFENVAFPLRVARKRPQRKELENRVLAALELVQLGGMEGRMATQLSGGQQQRLALARAIVGEPEILLLDEPLSNLDAKLRERMRLELRELQRRLGITSLYVTHDQIEALSMSDTIAVMDNGQIVQEGPPLEIYHRPKTEFVAQFIGSANLIPGRIVPTSGSEESVTVDTALGLVDCAGVQAQILDPDRGVGIVFRPERVVVHRERAPGISNLFRGKVAHGVFCGEYVDLRIEVSGVSIRVRHQTLWNLAAGDDVWLELPPDALSLLNVESEHHQWGSRSEAMALSS